LTGSSLSGISLVTGSTSSGLSFSFSQFLNSFFNWFTI